MATLLFTWELGGGFGHLVPLRPLVIELLGRGHRVVLAVKILSRAKQVFAGVEVELLQAPHLAQEVPEPFMPPSGFTHLLHNSSVGHPSRFAELLTEWGGIFERVEPALVVFDHSPTALLAARGRAFATAQIGTGFCCPVPETPFPSRRSECTPSTAELQQQEQGVLDDINAALVARGQSRINVLAECLATDATLLTTWPELDHGAVLTEELAAGKAPAARTKADYLGAWSESGGAQIEWPAGEGRRAFFVHERHC